MAYIRERKELLTGCQEGREWSPEIDLQYDFVMVYGIDEGMPDRVRAYREKGYAVHVMTGSAWGRYRDFLDGEWDGRSHWDESQTNRAGEPILHGVDVPYLSPSVALAGYLSKRLEAAVDAGAEAIHLEEPEFWDEAGYSEGFKREYRLFYGEEWVPPHTSPAARWRASRLKVWLYKRLISRVSEAVKEYAMTRYNRRVPFYVATHSLVNYTQWKILSPEGELLDIPTVDGCIAQVWTGTSRCGNVYAGKYAERTFETAFLEYGVMQELVRGTGRRMWFLHDPIEDFPERTWEDFRGNYIKTLAASLLHPDVHTYEVCPWPTRIFTGVYPKRVELKGGIAPGAEMEGAKPIPQSYAQLICAMAQLLGDMDQADASFEGNPPETGILLSDSCLYERSFPDSVPSSPGGVEGLNGRLFAMLDRQREGADTTAESRALMEEIARDEALYHDYIASGAYPHFFGLALPLLKRGLPIRPVQLENAARYPGYLDRYRLLVLSYEFLKPASPALHFALAEWVRNGGALLYVGDGADPYHAVPGWWNSGALRFASPAEHLFRCLGLPPAPGEGIYPFGKGFAAVLPVSPARLTFCAEETGRYWAQAASLAERLGCPIRERNYLLMRRGPYRIAGVMTESVSDAPLTLTGLYCDLLAGDFPIVEKAVLHPGEQALLFDLAEPLESPRIVASSARVFSLDCDGEGFSLTAKAASGITAQLRLRLPRPVRAVTALRETGEAVEVRFCWDEKSRTVLLSYESQNLRTTLKGTFC